MRETKASDEYNLEELKKIILYIALRCSEIGRDFDMEEKYPVQTKVLNDILLDIRFGLVNKDFFIQLNILLVWYCEGVESYNLREKNERDYIMFKSFMAKYGIPLSCNEEIPYIIF